MNLEIVKSVYTTIGTKPLFNPTNSYFKDIKYPENISEQELTVRKLKELCLRLVYNKVWHYTYVDTQYEVKAKLLSKTNDALLELEKEKNILAEFAKDIDDVIYTHLVTDEIHSVNSLQINDRLRLLEIYMVYLENYAKPIITSIIKDKERQNLPEDEFSRNHRYLWELSLVVKNATDLVMDLLERQAYAMQDEEYVRNLTPRQKNQIDNLLAKQGSLKLNLPQTFNSINMLKDDYISAAGKPYSKETMQIYTRVVNIFIPQLVGVIAKEIENFKL